MQGVKRASICLCVTVHSDEIRALNYSCSKMYENQMEKTLGALMAEHEKNVGQKITISSNKHLTFFNLPAGSLLQGQIFVEQKINLVWPYFSQTPLVKGIATALCITWNHQ